VTPPSIYRHFPDKTTLIYQVCARHFGSLDSAIDAAVEGIPDPLKELEARGRAYVLFGRDNPEPYRIMFMVRPEQSPASAAQEEWVSGSQTFQQTVANVQRCIDAGAFRPEFDDALHVTLGFWARVHGITSLMVSKPVLPLSEDAFIDKYLETCLHGIASD
jgi:AcrR family transcriptional regulator